jgi:hypothetical protein
MQQLVHIYDSLTGGMTFLSQYACLSLRRYADCFFLAFVLMTVSDGTRLRQWMGQFRGRIGVVLSLSSVGLLLLSSVVYAMTIGFCDHIEPTVLSVSWLWGHGQPLYPGPAAAERYGMLYGPITYLADSAALSAFGDDIRVVKMVGLTLLVMSFVLLGGALKRNCSWSVVIVCMGYAAVGTLVLERSSAAVTASWIRPDPHMLFWASIGLFCSTSRRPAVAILGTGIAMAMCANVKLHGAAYLLPMLVPVYQRTGAKGIWACVGVAILAALTPFWVFRGVSLSAYLGVVAGAGRHELWLDPFFRVLGCCLFLLTPIVAVFLVNLVSRTGEDSRSRLAEQAPQLAAILLATALIMAPASKAGSGPNHLLPLLPSFALALGGLLSWPREEFAAPRWVVNGALSAVAVFTIIGFSISCEAAHRLCGYSRGQNHVARAAIGEIEDVCRRWPDSTIGMSFGSEEKYAWTWYRPILTFRGGPYLVDAPALMDLARSGFPVPESTVQALREGQVKVWLIPAGDEPFSMASLYRDDKPLFDQHFRDEFRAHYRRVRGTEHFDAWVYSGAHNELSSTGP